MINQWLERQEARACTAEYRRENYVSDLAEAIRANTEYCNEVANMLNEMQIGGGGWCVVSNVATIASSFNITVCGSD